MIKYTHETYTPKEAGIKERKFGKKYEKEEGGGRWTGYLNQ